MIALAFASLARSFKADKRPRMSATQRTLPWAESSTFVCVFTWCTGCTGGLGETAECVDVEAGRCIVGVVGEKERQKDKK